MKNTNILSDMQSELKVPKGQFNGFGKYKYRSCEDILEALKPHLKKHAASLILSDEIIQLGERFYIKATAKLFHNGEEIASTTALARESLDKKGMDDSQITGTASSYARKYALNGLFCIDDTKDADTDEYAEKTKQKEAKNTSSDRQSVVIVPQRKQIPIPPKTVADFQKSLELSEKQKQELEEALLAYGADSERIKLVFQKTNPQNFEKVLRNLKSKQNA